MDITKSDYKRICSCCLSFRTAKNIKGHEKWYIDKKVESKIFPILCDKCYNRLITKPIYRKKKKNMEVIIKHYNNHNKKKLKFLGKALYISFRQITGYCSRCPNNIYDNSCKKTDMHHYFYCVIMPWACREELCPSCHHKGKNISKESRERMSIARKKYFDNKKKKT